MKQLTVQEQRELIFELQEKARHHPEFFERLKTLMAEYENPYNMEMLGYKELKTAYARPGKV